MDGRKIVEDVEVTSHQSQASNMFDGNEDTCWFSGHGHMQCIEIHLSEAVHVRRVVIHFQKEFHCTKGRGCITTDNSSEDTEMKCLNENGEGHLVFSGVGDHIKIFLEESSDMYGRYCIYNIDLLV